MRKTADAVVIGGGIAGASVAHFLARKGFGKIVLLEKGRLAGVCTGRSAAIVRTYYSNPITVKLAWRAVQMFENDQEALGGDSGFRQIGFLLLLDEGWKTAGDQILEMESTHGVPVRELSREDIRELAPPLNLEGIVRAIFEPRSGCADPIRTTESLVNGARQWGLTAHVGVDATGIRLDGGRVRSVETEQGTIETPVVVNAAGPWGRRVGLWAGLNYSVRWSRETDLIVTQPDDLGSLPVISDPPQRAYYKPHNDNTMLAGLGYPKEVEPLDIDSYNEDLDADQRGRIETCLFRRIPVLREMEYHHGYASIYTIMDDWHPIVGPEPHVEGYYAFFGGSGHGFKIGPPLGEALADVIAGEEPEIDIHQFRPSRFLEGEIFSSAWGGGNRG